jgi:hypothetical protein
MCHLALFSGVDFKVKVMEAAGPDGRPKRVKVTIWDTGHNKKNFVAMHSSNLIVCQLVKSDSELLQVHTTEELKGLY